LRATGAPQTQPVKTQDSLAVGKQHLNFLAITARSLVGFGFAIRSMGALVQDLDRRGIRTKASARLDGSVRGGIRFGVGPLQHLLRNRFYLGEIVYRGEVYAGEHEPIIGGELFDAVQARRAANAVARNVRLSERRKDDRPRAYLGAVFACYEVPLGGLRQRRCRRSQR